MARTLNSDKEALEEAAKLQSKSKDALHRMQQQLEDTEQVGDITLEELQAQRRQLDGIESKGKILHDKLDETDKLQRKFAMFGGLKKKMSKKKKVAQSSTDRDEAKDSDEDEKNAEKKKKWKLRKSSKHGSKGSSAEVPVIFERKVFLEDNMPQEHEEELNALARGDEELDAQLDVVGSQLKAIQAMAQEMGAESKKQGQTIEKIHTQVEEAAPRLGKVNKKTRKLMR